MSHMRISMSGVRHGVVVVVTVAAAALFAHPSHAADALPAGLEVRHRGSYFEVAGLGEQHQPLDKIRFEFKDLKHRAPWCLFYVMLDEPVDLTRGEIRLRFGRVSDDVNLKIELRDAGFDRSYQATRRAPVPAGTDGEVRLAAADGFEELIPGGWTRRVLWPDWRRVRYIGVIVEARYNRAEQGTIELEAIEYHPADGQPRSLALWSDRVFCDEYTPSLLFRRWVRGMSDDRIAAELLRGRLASDSPEVVDEVRRDDPSTALFISGQGYKLDAFSPVGIAAQGRVEEVTHRLDGLLISATRMLRFPERPPGVTDSDIRRSALSEPVDVRSWLGEVVFDPVDGPLAGGPRIRFTYEDVDVESDSSIRLDFRQQVHEVALLWATDYLDDGRRWRIVFEPAYQYWKVTSGSDDFARLDKHRGVLGATIRDEWEQREFFLLGFVGKSNHKDADADEVEHRVLAEWRQWYGLEKLAFSTVGVGFTETEFQIPGRPDDQLREFEAFASLITELDTQGRWRWVGEVSFRRTDADILIFFPTSERGHVTFDFWEFQTRLVNEVVPDVDTSFGLEHAVADDHAFDYAAVVGRVSFFNAGPFRGEVGARHTWYYNQDEDLSTLFVRLDFAR